MTASQELYTLSKRGNATNIIGVILGVAVVTMAVVMNIVMDTVIMVSMKYIARQSHLAAGTSGKIHLQCEIALSKFR